MIFTLNPSKNQYVKRAFGIAKDELKIFGIDVSEDELYAIYT